MTVIDFEFGLGDEVIVKPLKATSIVTGLMLDSEGLSYQVTYWNEGTRCKAWLYGWELERPDQEKACGF